MELKTSHLEELRARLAELTRLAAPTIIVADSLGLIAHVDPPLAQLLGWRADELVGRALSTIIPLRFREAHHLGFSRFLTSGEPTLMGRPLEMAIATRDGKELTAEHVITAFRVDERWVFGASIRTAEASDA